MCVCVYSCVFVCVCVCVCVQFINQSSIEKESGVEWSVMYRNIEYTSLSLPRVSVIVSVGIRGGNSVSNSVNIMDSVNVSV